VYKRQRLDRSFDLLPHADDRLPLEPVLRSSKNLLSYHEVFYLKVYAVNSYAVYD